jgi:hypothetical protein
VSEPLNLPQHGQQQRQDRGFHAGNETCQQLAVVHEGEPNLKSARVAGDLLARTLAQTRDEK